MNARLGLSALFAAALSSFAGAAAAHVAVDGPGHAGQYQVLNFGIGHGCAGADTVSIEVTLPSGLASVRGLPSDFGPMQVVTDDTGVVTSVVWTKETARSADDAYYVLSIRARLPNAPFTTLFFPTRQTCRDTEGTETIVDWAATPEEIAEAPDGGEPEPAPSLVVLPVRHAGWNKYDAAAAITDLSVFDDAEIVWVGDAAYSGNPTTMELIEGEDDVTVLTAISAGDEIWVKY